MMLELVAVDGAAAPAANEPDGGRFLPEQVHAELHGLREGQAKMMSVLLAQQSELSRLAGALATVRISRTQEIALGSAIKARASLLARTENLPGCERRIAGAIRTTIRETTGARAIGDLQAGQYDRTMEMISSWYMGGALRRIRRETER